MGFPRWSCWFTCIFHFYFCFFCLVIQWFLRVPPFPAASLSCPVCPRHAALFVVRVHLLSSLAQFQFPQYSCISFFVHASRLLYLVPRCCPKLLSMVSPVFRFVVSFAWWIQLTYLRSHLCSIPWSFGSSMTCRVVAGSACSSIRAVVRLFALPLCWWFARSGFVVVDRSLWWSLCCGVWVLQCWWCRGHFRVHFERTSGRPSLRRLGVDTTAR